MTYHLQITQMKLSSNRHTRNKNRFSAVFLMIQNATDLKKSIYYIHINSKIMIRNTLLVLLVFSLFSCSSDDDNSPSNLIGKWRLYEQLADPGDGSGTFRPIDSDKTLEFFANGVITSQNGSLCEPYSTEQITTGTYSVTENNITTNCQNPSIATISFEIVGTNLILNFVSIEGFSQKFRKIL